MSSLFEPIRTGRLLLRAPRPDDTKALLERRNDPRVAEYQNWETPYPAEKAEQMMAELVAMDGPADDEWWMITVADLDDEVVYGDLALHMTNGMRTAEIGYTLAPDHWGRGYATEAAEALVAWLFETQPATRVWGMLHPDNPASAMVLERVGMLYEGRTRLSFWVGDDNSDDVIYGMTRDDWKAWRDRSRSTPGAIMLVPVTLDNERLVFKLRTHKSQERFVAPMHASFADALFPEIIDGAPVVPWMRAVEADGELVGFVMVAVVTDHHPEPYLWRLLVDRLHQRRGIGAMVLDAVVEECRAMGATSLLTSWTEGRGTPRPFYERYGFELTGEIIDGEIEARYTFR